MNKDLSNKIRKCRDGVYNNPYQGKDKRVLFVCSMGLLRSPTGARLYAHKYNTRACGTWTDALVPMTKELMGWADEIVFVDKENYLQAKHNIRPLDIDSMYNIKVLNISDKYPHMHPELIKEFNEQYEPITMHGNDYGDNR